MNAANGSDLGAYWLEVPKSKAVLDGIEADVVLVLGPAIISKRSTAGPLLAWGLLCCYCYCVDAVVGLGGCY